MWEDMESERVPESSHQIFNIRVLYFAELISTSLFLHISFSVRLTDKVLCALNAIILPRGRCLYNPIM